MPRPPFSKVAEARQAIADRAVEMLELYIINIKLAQAEGEFEVAQKSLEWLMAHTPADELGVKIVDQDIDKPKAVEQGRTGPQINIGFQLGGMKRPAELPAAAEAEVIDVTPKPKGK
jgi:hypothetical protein